MEAQRCSLSLRGALSVFAFTLLLLEPGNAGMPAFFPISQLCKFCDVEQSSCSGTGTCMSNCSITSICMKTSEVCVAIWRKNETGFSIETLCHNPSKPLYGVMLDDYNTSTCVMKEKNTTSGMAHFCSCTDEEECNDKLIFSPSAAQMPPKSRATASLQKLKHDLELAKQKLACQEDMIKELTKERDFLREQLSQSLRNTSIENDESSPEASVKSASNRCGFPESSYSSSTDSPSDNGKRKK